MNRIFRLMLVGGALLLAVTGSAQSAAPNEKPGAGSVAPAALESYRSSTPAGSTDFNAADRLAIINLVKVYALTYDNYEIDKWLSLFTDKAVFVAGVPGQKPLVQSGKTFREFWKQRGAAFEKSGNKRRHLISNVVFLDQTSQTAHISAVGLLMNTKNGAEVSVLTPLNYEGWFVKHDGVWKIEKWHDFPDSNP